MRSVTKQAIREARLKEIKEELLHSEKLKVRGPGEGGAGLQGIALPGGWPSCERERQWTGQLAAPSADRWGGNRPRAGEGRQLSCWEVNQPGLCGGQWPCPSESQLLELILLTCTVARVPAFVMIPQVETPGSPPQRRGKPSRVHPRGACYTGKEEAAACVSVQDGPWGDDQ